MVFAVADEAVVLMSAYNAPPVIPPKYTMPLGQLGVPPPPPMLAQPVALPLARMPVGACPVLHRLGVLASAVAVAALPVVDAFGAA
jgi:hypothetical protein